MELTDDTTPRPQAQTTNTQRVISEEKTRTSPQLPKEETSDSTQPVEHKKKLSNGATPAKSGQISKPLADIAPARKPLTSAKSESRSDEDYEPPACNCPGIYISCILIHYLYSNAKSSLAAAGSRPTW